MNCATAVHDSVNDLPDRSIAQPSARSERLTGAQTMNVNRVQLARKVLYRSNLGVYGEVEDHLLRLRSTAKEFPMNA
jgi:hypothetical protein